MISKHYFTDIMSHNTPSYSLKVVYTDKIDSSFVAVQNTTRASCIDMCYWSLICATMFYDSIAGNCYISNRIYTILQNHPKLTNKVGTMVYQWASGMRLTFWRFEFTFFSPMC